MTPADRNLLAYLNREYRALKRIRTAYAKKIAGVEKRMARLQARIEKVPE